MRDAQKKKNIANEAKAYSLINGEHYAMVNAWFIKSKLLKVTNAENVIRKTISQFCEVRQGRWAEGKRVAKMESLTTIII